MKGIKDYVGAGGSAADVLPPEVVLETFLGLDADEVLGGEADEEAAMEALDESDPRVRETFEDLYGPEEPDGGDDE